MNTEAYMITMTTFDQQKIGAVLNDTAQPLKERFRALFTLKNLGGHNAIDLIAQSF